MSGRLVNVQRCKKIQKRKVSKKVADASHSDVHIELFFSFFFCLAMDKVRIVGFLNLHLKIIKS